MASYCFQTAPLHVQKLIEEQTSAVNLPRVGSHMNKYFTTAQLNISAAESYTPPDPTGINVPSEPCTLGYLLQLILTICASENHSQLGQFAGLHVDQHDAKGGYSTMLWNSHIPAAYDPGSFYFTEVGIAISLHGVGGINFNGLHTHGGRLPTLITPQDEVSDSPTRLISVFYGQELPMSGNAVQSWLPFPTGAHDAKGIFSLWPELQQMSYVQITLLN